MRFREQRFRRNRFKPTRPGAPPAVRSVAFKEHDGSEWGSPVVGKEHPVGWGPEKTQIGVATQDSVDEFLRTAKRTTEGGPVVGWSETETELERMEWQLHRSTMSGRTRVSQWMTARFRAMRSRLSPRSESET